MWDELGNIQNVEVQFLSLRNKLKKKKIMERLGGGIGFSNTSSATTTRKKRSTTLRRPWNERQLQDASSLPSTPILVYVRNRQTQLQIFVQV